MVVVRLLLLPAKLLLSSPFQHLDTSNCPTHSPLVIGKRPSPHGDEWCIASEDCAFGPIGFERVRDVLPGEMVVITEEGKLMSRQCAQVRTGGKSSGRRQGWTVQ